MNACALAPWRSSPDVSKTPVDFTKSVRSADGVNIAYETYGDGDTTLVFIHGWSCDRTYWRNQIEAFSEDYKIVLVDLAGHGASGAGRNTWSIEAFGDDVAAAARAAGARDIVLIGHSMGGPVALEAARRLGPDIRGIIGVETLKTPGGGLKSEDAEAYWGRDRRAYATRADKLVRATFFLKGADASLVDWVAADIAAAPPDIAIASAIGNFTYDMLGGLIATRNVPLILLNANTLPTDVAAHRDIRPTFSLFEFQDMGHFPMLEAPETFNAVLREALTDASQGALRVTTASTSY